MMHDYMIAYLIDFLPPYGPVPIGERDADHQGCSYTSLVACGYPHIGKRLAIVIGDLALGYFHGRGTKGFESLFYSSEEREGLGKVLEEVLKGHT